MKLSLKQYLARFIKPKFQKTTQAIKSPAKILDIGIANSSYIECKSIFKDAEYHGIDNDLSIYNVISENDKFFLIDMESDDFRSQIDADYDLIILNHVLEHLSNAEQVFASLLSHLKPGGVLFAEYPSIKTAYHRKTLFSYHFHDDPTHKRFLSLTKLANLALEHDAVVISCGPATTPLKSILAFPRALLKLLQFREYGSELLHLSGKIEYIMIRKL